MFIHKKDVNSLTCNKQKLETIQVSINRRQTNKGIFIQKMLHRNKKEQTADSSNNTD